MRRWVESQAVAGLPPHARSVFGADANRCRVRRPGYARRVAKKRAKRDNLPKLKAPSVRYDGGPDALAVELRAALPLPARARYHEELHDLRRSTDDSWQRALEFLWEQLGTSWEIAGSPIAARKELLGRYRLATQPERKFVRESLRAHLAEYFPEMERP